MSTIAILRRRPEDIKADADRDYHGDTEKVPTATFDKLYLRGITIVSRYGKADELQLMADVVEDLPNNIAELVGEFYCDSKAGSCYQINLRRTTTRGTARTIAGVFHFLILAGSSGHNGIVLQPSSGWSENDVWVDTYWKGDWEEG